MFILKLISLIIYISQYISLYTFISIHFCIDAYMIDAYMNAYRFISHEYLAQDGLLNFCIGKKKTCIGF